jgi:AcrR family transcriptional regulator
MLKKVQRRRNKDEDTPTLLVEAAAREFQECGFDGTDTNRIARRAGFAPQTFYRWFGDKMDIFIAVYQSWVGEEFDRIEQLGARGASDSEFIDVSIAHHRAYNVFRRSLRQLTVQNPALRKARSDSRLQQIQRVKAQNKTLDLTTAEVAIFLFEYERLCDALADEEFLDLGVDESAVRSHLAKLYKRLRKQ